jgi:hypothetical protein
MPPGYLQAQQSRTESFYHYSFGYVTRVKRSVWTKLGLGLSVLSLLCSVSRAADAPANVGRHVDLLGFGQSRQGREDDRHPGTRYKL